jgi:hypothetical protein
MSEYSGSWNNYGGSWDCRFRVYISDPTGFVNSMVLTSDNGYVGLGTTVPSAKVDVVGLGTTSATNSLILRNSSKTAYFTVNDAGNVGIGTASPEFKLTVRAAGATAALKSGANTACTTTCGTAGCLFGQNTADYAIVDCAGATADVCICLGN